MLSNIFPIRSGEYVKFLLLAAIAFLVCTNYTLLRTAKETLIITKPGMGIQIVPFLRTWLLMPIMLLFVKIYAMLSGRYRQETVCYYLISSFLTFFALFTFVLYPYEDLFRMEKLGTWISSFGFPFAEQFGAMVNYWSFSIYYCLAEVWGSIVVLILFWGVSNRANTPEEAQRFYSPILLITNLSGFFASQISLYFSQSPLKYLLFAGQQKWPATLLSITLFVCIVTAAILFLFYLFFQHTRNNQSEHKTQDKQLSKEEMSLTKIIFSIEHKKIVLSLSIMVFAYFFASGILEIIWKYYLQKVHPDSNDFNDYLSRCTAYISIVSSLLALGVTGNLIRRFSWRLSAVITPLVLLIPVSGFIIVCFYFDADPIYSTFFGAGYYCLNRICKFTFFDLSKEIATVEMTNADQIKSKTILDGLIPKLAKTGESLLVQLLLIFFGSLSSVIPPILILMLVIHLVWAYAIKGSFQNENLKNPILESNL